METYLRNHGDRMPEGTTPMGLEPDEDGNFEDETSNQQLNYGNNNEDFSHTITQQQQKQPKTRWLILTLTCTVMTASYYSFDIPSALHQQLQDYMPQSSNFERNFNLLYTVYSIPNVVLPLFGGNFVDRFGAPACLFSFASLVCCGSVILSIGVSSQTWEVMYLGRFVFGLGAESLCVAQSTITSEWFEGNDLAFAMGIGLAVSRLGSIFNNIISPKVANSRGGIQTAFWIGPLLTFSALFAAALIIFIDRRKVKKLKRRDGGVASTELTEALLEEDAPPRNDDDKPSSESDEVHLTDFRKFGILFWLLTISCFVVYGCVLPFNNVASGILLERNYYKPAPSSCHLLHPDQCTSGYLQNGTNPSLSDSTGALCSIAPFQAPLLPLSVNFTSSASEKSGDWENEAYFYPNLTTHDVKCNDPFWNSACTSDYCSKESASTERAGKVMSIPYLISALSSPPLGLLVDKIGRRAQIATFASGLLFIVHLTMAVSHSSPILPLIGQGIAYSCYAAVIWPSVPLTVDKKYTGTAFGVITSVQNIGLALFPLMIASIYKASGNSYIPNVEFFFMSCAGLGVLIGLLLNRLDRRYGGKLNEITISSDDERREDAGFAEVEDEYFSPLLHPS